MAKVTDSNHKIYPSIYRKIRWGFGVLTLAMFTLFWSLIYIAENQLEVLSLQHWLDSEVTLYQMEYRKLGWDAPLPNVSEFDSYWSGAPTPDWLKKYQSPGFYEYLLEDEDKHFVVFEHPSGEGLMYIVFQDDADDYLDDYESALHNQTFMIGGIFSLLMIGYGVYMVHTISSPLAAITRKIRLLAPEHSDFAVNTPFSETREIEQALLDSKHEIGSFFQREQDFSRFASHELRTPIMVIRGSSDILKRIPDLPPVAEKAVNRTRLACEEMHVLTETFLLLAKNKIEASHFVDHSLFDYLSQQLAELAPLFARQGISYQLNASCTGVVHAPESFVTIVLNNLIKNAFSYSTSDIQISLDKGAVTIINRHDGNDTFNAGYGAGLVIVERICEKMDWQFERHDDGVNYTAKIDFHSNYQGIPK